ncbi:hypothetical protein D7B24_001812 [Verticillium nonalfalfae]|uniref:ATPase expression protein 2, mitochondrial n=1 Tax=Verticillium nonalfalfae TaxID=1051616 RepID=A0A3M9YIM5_9PEZI|nr:uncharacterized protein D7B24_001812 [Verticillium nonalfalfae]RNJ59636.1 hypothetical protein D7B24_001812 [Verticillium nonalfalfae]
MIPTLFKTEAIGMRQCLRPVPLGTSSRVLLTRLRRFTRARPAQDGWGRLESVERPAAFDVPPPVKMPDWGFLKPNTEHVQSVTEPKIRYLDRQPSRARSDQRQFAATTTLWDRSEEVAIKNDDPMAPWNLSSLLVETLRTRDVVETLSVVRALVNSPSADEAIAAMRGIPRTTVSEILRCLDPLEAGHRLDCTHSLVIPDHLQEFSPVALAFDEFGVRKIYKDLFTTMVAFVELLHQAGHQLMLADYVVLLRCAGATSDVTAAKRVWKLMDLNEVWDLREGLGYDELVKARYLVEPLYRQYDLARVRLRPRNLRKVNRPDMALRGRLEKLRLYEARSKYHAYGKSPHQPERDLHWVLSLPGPLNRIWFKMLNQGVTITESLQCSYLVACGYAGNLRMIETILARFYDISIVDGKTRRGITADSRNVLITGGRKFPHGHPLTPTPRLLNALVHSLGAAGYVLLAKKLVEFFAQQYRLDIAAATWSDLLNHTYIISTHRAQVEWGLYESNMAVKNRAVRAEDVLDVYHAMTAHGIEPSFEDLDKRVNALIQSGAFDEAWTAIRSGSAHYRTLMAETQDALFEALYPSPPRSASDRVVRAKAKQHRAWYALQRWCDRWLLRFSRREARLGVGDTMDADGDLTRRIPDFVAEFVDYMPYPATYHVASGLVRLQANHQQKRMGWEKRDVASAPTLVVERDGQDPRLDEDGRHVVSEAGQPQYHVRTRTYQHLDRRAQRTRRAQPWEAVGFYKHCVADGAAEGGWPHLKYSNVAHCVEW